MGAAAHEGSRVRRRTAAWHHPRSSSASHATRSGRRHSRVQLSLVERGGLWRRACDLCTGR
jgi:hypothetical protein